MTYQPDKKSIRSHKVPDWFHDDKFGIFIHWGLYSVPAFAVTGRDITESMAKLGMEGHMTNNPYAEWYLNSLRIPGSPAEKYHFETYGKEFSYDDFVPVFNKELLKWNPQDMVDLFKKAGARYIVLVTKHHDGFTLWPSKYKNPNRENYFTSRNVVKELTDTVKASGMRMGLYYSGMLDWSFEPGAIKDDVSFSENGVKTKEYTEYADNHWYELIDNYEPVILWNDIGYPPHTNLYELFAYFYNKIPEGVVNDRWRQPFVKGKKNGNVSHKDFATPEYKVFKEIMKRKWECTRGIGNSYGYNKFETEKDYMNSAELVRLFVDIVSKNGNLLLNVGPKPDGTIPELQAKCLEGFGKWMEINGEAIYGTRPWSRAEGKTTDNIDVRFTQNQDAFFIILLDRPAGERAEIISLMVKENSVIQLLGHNQPLDWKRVNDNLEISVPDMPDLPDAPAYSFKVTPKP